MKSRRPASRGAFVALLALGLALVPARAHAIDEELLGALKRVQAVRIEGNAAVKDDAIKKVIKTGAGSFLGLRSLPLYRPDFLRSDAVTIQNLYARRGFLAAAVTAQADSGDRPGRVIVTYRISEGPQTLVRAVGFDSTGAMASDRVRAAIKLKAGQPYDPVQVVLDRTAIAELYAERGYFPTITTSIASDSNRVSVRFGIVPGPAYHVRSVGMGGMSEVDTAAVRRELLLEPGDLFERERMIKSSERLYETGLFNSVEVQPGGADSALGLVDIHAQVRERKPRWVEGGVGFGTYEKVSLSTAWGNRNLWGVGRALTAEATWGYYQPEVYRYRAALAYTEPWLFGIRLRGRVVPSLERDFTVYSTGTYIQEAWGLSFGLTHDFTMQHSRVSLTLDNTWTTLTDIINPEPTADTTFFIAPYVRRWTLAYDQDLRDDSLDPRRGALTHLSAQLAGSVEGGQGRYLKLDGSEGLHTPRRLRGSFGVRLRSAWITGVGPGPSGDAETIQRVPTTDRLRIGGGSSVRGYRENGIDDSGNGGRFLVNANFEMRFPVRGILSGAVFVDAGNVWRAMQEVKLSRMFHATGIDGTYGMADLRWSAGGGVRAHTPIGPLRLDFGYRLAPEESDLLAGRTPHRTAWSFSIGQLF